MSNINIEGDEDSLVKIVDTNKDNRQQNFNRFAMRHMIEQQESLTESQFEAALAIQSPLLDDEWLKYGIYPNQHRDVLKTASVS